MPRRIGSLFVAVFVVTALTPLSARAGGFCLHQEEVTDRRSATVDMKDYCFFPQVVRVDKGDVVTWTNYDSETHTITAPGGWGGGHDDYLQGDEISFRFEREGVFPYVCLLHPGMVGTVVVGDGEGRTSAKPPARSVDFSSSGADAVSGTEGSHRPDVSAQSEADERESSLLPILGLVVATVVAAALLYALAVWLRRRHAPLHTG